MRKILTENAAQEHDAAQKNANHSVSSRINSLHFLLLTAVLIISYASDSFANRPSMNDIEDEDESTESSTSSVERMMQQQSLQKSGNTLNLPAQEIQQGETIKIKLLDSPRRGTSMQNVRQAFGEPMNASDSVGKPPITSWTYPDRIVYFEYSTVLHVVAR